MQLQFSHTTDPSLNRIDSRSLDSPKDVLRVLFYSSDHPILPLHNALAITCFAISLFSLFNLLLAYTSAYLPLVDKPPPTWVITLRHAGFCVCMTVSFLIFFFYVTGARG